MSERARHIYELRVADVDHAEQTRRNVVAGAVNLVLGPLGDSGMEAAGTVVMHIVDRRTGAVVVSMTAGQEAPGLAKLISADLDRLDAVAFAAEWGIDGAGSGSTS